MTMKNNFKIMVFAYDFPNYKTEIILKKLLEDGYKIEYVIGAPKVQLNREVSELPDSPGIKSLVETSDICSFYHIPYHVFPHNSKDCEFFLKNNPVEIGIIAGAQIIKENIINQFKFGIINTHEGLLPFIRGLDTLKWSIYANLPMANSIHFISTGIDQGRLIYAEKTEIKEEDTLKDVANRMITSKPEVLVSALERLNSYLIINNFKIEDFSNLATSYGIYGRIMPKSFATKVVEAFEDWKFKNLGIKMEIDPFSSEIQKLANELKLPDELNKICKK